MNTPDPGKRIRFYYVDESGDGVLFGRRGRLLLGQPGSLRFFMLGLLDVSDPAALQSDMDALRAGILKDPYFKNVPSLTKTARAFHAKDDLPEVRREVFRVLLAHDVKFSAVVKDMHSVADYVRNRNLRDPQYRYHPNELYDLTAQHLFRARLHREEAYRVFFALRSESGRTRLLKQAVEAARDRFCTDKGIRARSIIHVDAAYPHQHTGLQAVDYFLWALQRLYNSGEERFISMLWEKVSVVEDVDDIRKDACGEYYTKRKPISIAAVGRQKNRPTD
jgi:hypothetical protein